MNKCDMRRIDSIAVAAALVAGLAFTTTAHAGFVNEVQSAVVPNAAAATAAAVPATSPNESPRPIAETSALAATRKVTQIGFRPTDIDVPRGKGRDVALADMLPVIVPHGFTIDFGNVDRNRLANWNGGLPWDSVLADAIAPVEGVGVTIDWDRRVVALHRMAAPGAAPTQATQPSPSAAPANVPAAGTDDTFALVGGQSLESQLQSWAKRAGWAVSWNTPDDWIVPHDYVYSGSFQDVVQKVFTQLADDGADVRADIWKGNNSVVVDKAGAHE